MSKPVARVALISLISLLLIAAAYMTVQGAFAKAETKSTGAQAHVVSGLQTNFNHDRSTVSELEAMQSQSQPSQPETGRHGDGGGCESERQAVPLD
ncbi:MAG TPA: hypothetical protein VFM05_00845 [Candidatus Saccharimonadales bacterium]|nr:hypothetical protein [Candidatus Saccharimonadales bacterium]